MCSPTYKPTETQRRGVMRKSVAIVIFFLFTTICFASYAFADGISEIDDAERAYKEGMELLELALPSDIITPKAMMQHEAGYARHGRDRNVLFAKTVDCFRRAILLDPRSSKAYNSMGIAFSEWSKYSGTEALNAYARAGDVDPTFPWGHKNAGDLLLRNKKYEGAISAYKSFLKFDTKYDRAEVLFKLGTIAAALGQRDNALRYFQNAIEVSTPRESWRDLAEAEIQRLQKTNIQ